MVKKHFYHGIEIDRQKAKKELGDIIHYAAVAADALGIQFEDTARANITKLRVRYPDGFVEGGGNR